MVLTADWSSALDILSQRGFDFVVVADNLLSQADLAWGPRAVALSRLEPVKNLRAEGLLPVWIDEISRSDKLRKERDLLVKQADERWSKSCHDFERVFEFSDLASLLVSKRGKILRANQRATLLLGRAPMEVEGVPLTAFVPVEELDGLLHRLWNCSNGESLSWVQSFRPFNGGLKTVRVSAYLLEGTQTLQVNLSDTCSELRLNNQLQQVQQDLEALLEGSADGVIIGDSNCRVLEVNAVACQLLGCSREEIFGHFWHDFGLRLELSTDHPQVAWFHKQTGQSVMLECRQCVRRTGGRLRRLLILRDLSPFRQSRLELSELRERERAAVGQELHDDLGQQLTALSYLAEMVSSRLQNSSNDSTRDMANQIARLARQSIGKTRALARGLYPVVLERRGLAEALVDLATTTEEYFRFPCRVRARSLEVDRRLGLHLFRIAQEAVTNAAKHSRCRSLEISLQADNTRIWMEVRDDGKGLCAKEVAVRSGLGLRSMRQHADLMEGGLEVESWPGEGTSIYCWAPREIPRHLPL